MSKDSRPLAENRIRVFSPRLEKLNLLFPLLFVLPVLFEGLSSYAFTAQDKTYGTFIAKILFLNHVHIYFSFALILWSPEIQSWVRTKSDEGRFLKSRALLVLVGMFATFRWILPALKSSSSSSSLIFDCVMAVTLIAGFHHNYSQSFGLSLGYNRGLRPPGWIEKAERVLVTFIMATQFARILLVILVPNDEMLLMILGVAPIAAALAVIAICSTLPPTLNAKKLFVLRYLIFAAIPFSFTAFVGMMSIHGIEYFCVFRQMQNNSIHSSRLNRSSVTYGSFAFILVMTAIAILGRSRIGFWIQPILPADSSFALFLSMMVISATYLHYHIDGLMFRMRDPATRATVGPLLFDQNVSPEARTVLTESEVKSYRVS